MPSPIEKPRLLILSHVLPFPRSAGQQQRVFYTLETAREHFHVTLAAPAKAAEIKTVKEKLLTVCDEAIVLPSRYASSLRARAWHKVAGAAYAARTGLKLSNYVIGRVEFSPERVLQYLDPKNYDCVLFEYWHAASSAAVFHRQGIPCVLDMHDILWRVREQQLNERTAPVLQHWQRRAFEKYKAAEENAWRKFDALIAINREEQKYVRAQLPPLKEIFYGPMGTDLSLWPYSWQPQPPSQPPRVAYYGGMASERNQAAARRCFERIMPGIWREHPETEFWIVGSNPPATLHALTTQDHRVKVTGYVENIPQLLGTMTAVLCPFTGKFGFRSRLVEVLALGVPIIATPDAVNGMELMEGEGLLLGADDENLARSACRLLGDSFFTANQSALARRQAESSYSLDQTYRRLMRELAGWVEQYKAAQSRAA